MEKQPETSYVVIIEQDGDVAQLACESLEEARMVRTSFMHYGKYSDIRIAKLSPTEES